MKYLGKFILWVILGALFGTAIGILARRLGFADFGGGALAGMMAGPIVIMFLLLADFLDELLFWALGGALLGAISLALFGMIGNRTVGSTGFSMQDVIAGAPIGAVLSTWLGAGTAIFKRGTTGVIGLLLSVIAGGFLGVAVWLLGDLIGGELYTLSFLGGSYQWRLGEAIAGIPIAILTGVVTTRVIFPQDSQEFDHI